MTARRSLAVCLFVLCLIPQAPLIRAQTTTVNCSASVSQVQELRIDVLADQATADQIQQLIANAAQQPPTIGQLNDLVNDVARSLTDGVQQTEGYMAQVGNRIEALKLSRQGRVWPEHTKSIRDAGRRLRSELGALRGSDRAYTYVNGKAVEAKRVDPSNARVSAATRSVAATEPFNRVMQSANGYWTAVQAMNGAANQSGLSTALAGEDSFRRLTTQAMRMGENVDMLQALQALDAAMMQNLGNIGADMQRQLGGAQNGLAALEQGLAAACPQEMQKSQTRNQANKGNANPGQGGGHGAEIGMVVGIPAAIVGGALLYNEYKCGAAPDLSPLTPSNVIACRSSVKTTLDKIIAWCDCNRNDTECSSGTLQNYREIKADCGW